jgi:radical SAM superfamily enzyme YgiQ (UPF0313 family)
MTSLWPRIEPLLAHVTKPARYIGGELGARQPEHRPGTLAWLLVYPDTYEIGLPNQGLQILYEILNERPDAVAERAYAPWTDMEALMRQAGVPLFSLESHRSAGSFDVIAFNLSAELTYTNVLNLVDLAGVPVRVAERGEDHPLIVAGGHCAFNPEPLADFVDAFVLGDGEEVVGELTEAVSAARATGTGRHDLLRRLAKAEVLVLDDWLLRTLDPVQAQDVLDILQDRAGVGATVIVTQMPVTQWHGRITDPTLADAICDRLIHGSHRIELRGESQRKLRAARPSDGEQVI